MQCRHFTIRLSPQHLIEDEERLNTFLGQVQVHSIQTSLVAPKGERWSVLVFFVERESAAPARSRRRDETPPAADSAAISLSLSADERQVYERLREWRSERARAEGVPPYVVAHNAALLHIARHHMTLAATEDLAPIRRFGAQKAARYGPDILRLLQLGPAIGDALFEDDYAR